MAKELRYPTDIQTSSPGKQEYKRIYLWEVQAKQFIFKNIQIFEWLKPLTHPLVSDACHLAPMGVDAHINWRTLFERSELGRPHP
jgi:hypothetical protein